MTKREELLSLADRVEALAGPNFAIETEIAYALDLPLEGMAKPYTASLDAAMTLVPDGWRVYTADFSIKNRTSWMLEGPKLERIEQEDGTWEAGKDWYQSGTGTTPEIGLTVACLVTLASQEPNT